MCFDISSFKTLPLKDVVNIFSSFNNNSLNRDTGFILDNLKRHVNVNGTDYYFFSYDAITMCPGLTVFESEYEVLNDYFSEFFHFTIENVGELYYNQTMNLKVFGENILF